TCMLLAFPYAYFLVRVAGPRLRVILLVATVLPLWVSYLVRVYSWRLILNPDGALNWALNLVGLPDLNIAYTNWAMWVVFTYIWFPFMVLPVYAALERVPQSYLEASADLGAHGPTTLRRVILPLAVPRLAAGAIFTLSWTLGDYIAPSLVGGPGSSLIGTVVFENLGLANNAPFAAAFATVPLAIMAVYLLVMKPLRAVESLLWEPARRASGCGRGARSSSRSSGSRSGSWRSTRSTPRTSRASRSPASRRSGSTRRGTTRRCEPLSGCRSAPGFSRPPSRSCS